MWISPVLYPRKSYALVAQLYGLGLATSISKRVRKAPNRSSSLPPRTNSSRFGPQVEAITIPQPSLACPSAATYHCSRAAAGCPGGTVPGLSFPIIAFVVSATLFAPLASWLALQRARPWALWFLFGVALGPIASLLLILAPPGRCPACDTRSIGWPRSCSNCGLVFGTEEAETVRFVVRRRSAAVGPTMADTLSQAVAITAQRPMRGPRRAASATAVATAAVGGEHTTPSRSTLQRRADGGAEDRGRRSATGLGRRPSGGSQATGPRELERESGAANEVASLGSGVFIGGSKSLQIGSRYLLARVGSKLQVLGPVHVDPKKVALRVPLGDVEATVLGDRLVIAPGPSGRGPDLAFGSVFLERNVDLGHELREGGPPRTASR